MQKPAPSQKSAVVGKIALVVCILLVPLIIANVTIIVKSYVRPDEVPGFLGFKPFIVLSDSMLPVISSGDLVVTKEVDPGQLVEGDVIAFREGNSVVTHRIVRIAEEAGARRFTTKGDNNNANDPVLVRAEMVEGKYVLNIPGLGNAALFMQTPAGAIVFIALPLSLFMVYESSRRKKADRERNERTAELQRELEEARRQIGEPKDDTKKLE